MPILLEVSHVYVFTLIIVFETVFGLKLFQHVFFANICSIIYSICEIVILYHHHHYSKFLIIIPQACKY